MARIEWQGAYASGSEVLLATGAAQPIEVSVAGGRSLPLLAGQRDHEVWDLRPYVIEARRWMGSASVVINCVDAANARRAPQALLTIGFGMGGCPRAHLTISGRVRTFSRVTKVGLDAGTIVIECEAELAQDGSPLPSGVMVDEALLAELEQLRSEKPALESRVAQLEAQLRDAQEASRGQADLVAERDRLAAQLQGARSDNEALRRTLRSQAQTRVAGAASRREGLDRALAEQLDAAEQAERELTDLTNQVAQAKARVDELEQEAAGRRAQIDALQDVANLTEEDVTRMQDELHGLAIRMGFDQESVDLMARTDPYLSGGTVAEALQGAREQLDLAEERMATLMRTREAYLLRVQTSITTTGGDGTIPLSEELKRSADGIEPEE